MLQAKCNASDPNAINAYMYAFDFGNSTPSAFSLGLWFNNTNALNNTSAQPPDIQRVNAVSCPLSVSVCGRFCCLVAGTANQAPSESKANLVITIMKSIVR